MNEMLDYVFKLHKSSIKDKSEVFPHSFEEIGPGYCYGPAFGHWDIVHQILDMLPLDREHVLNQIENNLANQREDGFLPGVIYFEKGKAKWSSDMSHPPVWPFAVEEFYREYEDIRIIRNCYGPLLKQIGWFEKERRAENEGFFYCDILVKKWESGVDDGVRFDNVSTGPLACVDATSHVYALYDFAAEWAERLGEEAEKYIKRAGELKLFIQEELFDDKTGFFHDIWPNKHFALEGFWPLTVGACTKEQADRVIDENLLNPERFFTPHPLSTVGANDELFELRMWRGPSWNSMTYWAAKGCIRYMRYDAAHSILKKALEGSYLQFKRTGTIWEYYHPFTGDQLELKRKPYTQYNVPCRDYLGHNPLLAMNRLLKYCEEKL